MLARTGASDPCTVLGLLRRTVWQPRKKKVNADSPRGPAIPLLGACPKNGKLGFRQTSVHLCSRRLHGGQR